MIRIFLPALFLITILLAAPALGQSLGSGEPLSMVLTPRHEAVLSSELFSKVVKIEKEMGQSFKQGDALVKLDDVQLALEVRKRAALASAAAKNYSVARKLRANKSISELEMANAQRDAEATAAELAMAKRLLDLCRIEAPFNGRVKQLFVHEYEAVKKGDPLIAIVDDWELLARVLVPSSAFGKVSIGQELEFQINQTGEKVRGKVSHINETLDPASATFEVYALIDNSAQTLRSGMSGRLMQ